MSVLIYDPMSSFTPLPFALSYSQLLSLTLSLSLCILSLYNLHLSVLLSLPLMMNLSINSKILAKIFLSYDTVTSILKKTIQLQYITYLYLRCRSNSLSTYSCTSLIIKMTL